MLQQDVIVLFLRVQPGFKSYIRLIMLKLLLPFLFFIQWDCPEQGIQAPGLDTDTIRIAQGLITGVKTGTENIVAYKGIPFAAPPIGDLRWTEPQPPAAWEGVRPCSSFGPSPMQGAPAPFSMWTEEFLIPKHPISEDCLYLNVWTGKEEGRQDKPVLVWIYGGGFSSGGSGVPIYDGEAMARKGIVFVSINYRVGIFGFLAHPELTAASGRNTSGNYGLMDQVAALKWIKQNIAAFGGDPNNITIAGQSAGSMSVNCLVASPLAKGLFNKAIAQSGANFSRGTVTLIQAEEDGKQFSKQFPGLSEGSVIEGLRKIPAADLMKKAQGIRGPIVDGYVLPSSIAEIFSKGEQNEVVLLTGWNEDEGLLFGPIKKADVFSKEVKQQYGDSILLFYPASNDEQAAISQLNLSRDLIFGLQNYTWANVQSKQGKKVYVYRFTRKVPATGEYRKYGAFHTGEVPYAYDNLKFVNRPWEKLDHLLASAMSTYWANFIKSGDPNGRGLPLWKPYDIKEKNVMFLGNRPVPGKIKDDAALNFLGEKLSH